MTHARLAAIPLALLLGVPATLAPPSAGAQGAPAAMHILVVPADMKWTDVGSLPAGAKMSLLQGRLDQAAPFSVRLRLPADYRVPPHRHPAAEHVTVLAGTLHVGMGEKFDAGTMTVVPAGGFFAMPPGMAHYVRTGSGPVELQLHGTGPWGIEYLDPKDDPRSR